MSFTIKVEHNIKQFTRNLTRLEKKSVPLAAAKALTFTAERVQKQMSELTVQAFKNPTRFTRNAFRKTSARPSSLEAMVYLKDIHAFRDHYLAVHVTGGNRPMRRSEERLGFYFAISKHSSRKRLTRGVIQKILADVGGFGRYAGDAANTKTKAQGGAKKIKYFIRGQVGRRIVYEKFGRGGKLVRPILVEIRKPKYRVRLPLYKVAQATYRIHFEKLFHKQLQRELNRALHN